MKHRLRLFPWRDGFDSCCQQLESQHHIVTALELVFPTAGSEESFVAMENTTATMLESLVESVQSLPRLEYLLLRVESAAAPIGLEHEAVEDEDGDTDSRPNNHHYHVFTLQQLNSILCSLPKLIYFTLIDWPILADDLDIQGFFESVRIHPTLQSVVLQKCSVASQQQLDLIEDHPVVNVVVVTQPKKGGDCQCTVQQCRVRPEASTSSTNTWLHTMWSYFCAIPNAIPGCF